jgi:hypothetical protein
MFWGREIVNFKVLSKETKQSNKSSENILLPLHQGRESSNIRERNSLCNKPEILFSTMSIFP